MGQPGATFAQSRPAQMPRPGMAPPSGQMSPPLRASGAASPPSSAGTSVPQNVQRVSLVDDGPVASGGSIRQIVRGARRQSSVSGGNHPTSPFDDNPTNPFGQSKPPGNQ